MKPVSVNYSAIYTYWFINQDKMKVKDMAPKFGLTAARFSQILSVAIDKVQLEIKAKK